MSSYNFDDDNTDPDFDPVNDQQRIIVWDDDDSILNNNDNNDLLVTPGDDDLTHNLLALNALDLGNEEEQGLGIIIPEPDSLLVSSPPDEQLQEGAFQQTRRSVVPPSSSSDILSIQQQEEIGKSNVIIIDENDPLASLEAAIEDDKPRHKVNKDWQAMISAIQGEEDGGVVDMKRALQQQPQQRPPPPSRSKPNATTSTNEAITMPDLVLLPKEKQKEQGDGPSPLSDELLLSTRAAAYNSSERRDNDDDKDIASRSKDARAVVFSILQPICSVILQSRSNPPELTSLLLGLNTLLGEVDVQGLQACIDYVLFPLRLILDCASSSSNDGDVEHEKQGVAIPAASNEKVVDATLKCLFTILSRCDLEKKEQILSVIARLTALLPDNDDNNNNSSMVGKAGMHNTIALIASEEIVQSILSNIVCMFTNMPLSSKAILAQDEEAAPLIGHLISKLLSTAERQSRAGSSGSRVVRATSYQALRTLIEAIHFDGHNNNNNKDADYTTSNDAAGVELLAFFIPGIVIGLVSALRSSPSHTYSLAIVEALKGLRSLLVATLGSSIVARLTMDNNDDGDNNDDNDNRMRRHTRSSSDRDIYHQNQEWGSVTPSDQAMAQLRHLADHQRNDRKKDTLAIESTLKDKKESFSPSRPTTTTSTSTTTTKALRATLTVEWLEMTSLRVSTLLTTSLPPLASHPNLTVRQTLASICADIADYCGGVLTSDARGMLLQVMLSLAEDEWREVAVPAKSWLNQQQMSSRNTQQTAAVSSSTAVFGELMESTLVQLVQSLPEALQKGEDSGMLHARQLTAALHACLHATAAGPNVAIASNNKVTIVRNYPTWLDACVSSFTKCFLPDGDTAALLLHAPPEMATAYASSSSSSVLNDTTATTTTPEPTTTTTTAVSVAVTLLPRMPLGLSLICSNKMYETLAKATHELSSAGSTTSSFLSLRTVFDCCLLRLEHLFDKATRNNSSNDNKRRNNNKGRKSRSKNQQHEQQLKAISGADSSNSTNDDDGDGQWQREATSLISLLSEFIYGTINSINNSNSSIRSDVESLVFTTLSLVVSDIIWNLPTSITTMTSTIAPPPLQLTTTTTTMKQLGSNVLLQRAALECIGTAARVVGPRFSANGKFMRLVLLPLFEKVADASPLVASSADAGLTSVCVYCGYHGNINELISDNVDYIIDGLCRQLRNIQEHTRAPQLFAALLSRAGTSPEVLLPMLAEPAQRALRGVSILARARSPEYVLPFLAALKEVAVGAEGVANKALKKVQNIAADVEVRYQRNVDNARKKKKQKEEEEEESSAATTASIEHIAGYFKERTEKDRSTTAAWHADDTDDEETIQVDMSPSDREALRIARRQAAAAASLARSITDCSGPLTASSSLSIAVQAVNVCMSALQALNAATGIIDLEEDKIEPCVKKVVDLKPPEPEVPRLLPSVHLFWAPLIGALKDWRVALIEVAAPSLAILAHLSGSFLTKRFAQEAWPILLSLLQHGPSGRSSSSSSSSSYSSSSMLLLPGDDISEAPALTQRARLAVLDCLKSIALNAKSSVILSHYNVAPAALSAVGELLREEAPPAIKEAATTTFMALAEVDGDAAWALLSSALYIYHPTTHTTMSIKQPSSSSSSSAAGVLPSYDEIFSKRFLNGNNNNVTGSMSDCIVPAGFKKCNGKKLKAMLGKLEQLPVRWHNYIIAVTT